MAEADSVPTPISRPITGAVSEASTNRDSANGWYLVPRRANPRNPMVAQNQYWYETITGQVPVGYIVATICVTAILLLAYWPSNILLILLLFSSSKRLRPQSTWSGR